MLIVTHYTPKACGMQEFFSEINKSCYSRRNA